MPAERAPSAFYLLPPERLLPASTLPTWIGRIVKSYSEPDANFVPVDPALCVKGPLAASTIANASLTASSQRHKSLAAALGASTCNASRETSQGGGLSFTSSEIMCVRLQNQDAVFDRMIQDEQTKFELQRMLARGDNTGYMITAVLIWCDATFTHSRERGIETSAGASVPISAIVMGTSGVALPSEVTDPSVSASYGRQDTAELSGESAGSHIFAIQYKTVRRSFFQFFGAGMKLKSQGPDLPASQCFAKKHPGDSASHSEDEDDVSSEVESDTDDDDGKTDEAKSEDDTEIDNETSGNGKVILEMDEDNVTWADVLDEDEEEIQRADITVDGEEIQFVFN
ncbi:hypothetical protein HYE68_002639 [Fusarium pseudograminearum]|nr:hypothetical protein HYE68_002639 [Fusarium pseudograminearum]